MPEALKPLGVETEPGSSVTWSGFWTNLDVNRCMVPVLCLDVYADAGEIIHPILYISADFRIIIQYCQYFCKLLR